MSATLDMQPPVNSAATSSPTADSTRAPPTVAQHHRGGALTALVVGVSILVAVEGILCIAAFTTNLKLNERYFSYVDAGDALPSNVDYPPFATKGQDRDIDTPLILCLVPLGYDMVWLFVICGWALLAGGVNSVLVLCVSVFGFPMWSICGSFNVLICLSAREEMWDPTFSGQYGFLTAVQVLLGVGWLMVLIAAARSVDKRKKEKWMAEGVQRAMRRQGVEGLEGLEEMELPAYRA